MKKRILQKILLLIITSLISPMLFAQCGTIMVNSSQLQYPDTITNLPVATIGSPYQSTIQFFSPTSISGLAVNRIVINGVVGLPAGFSSSTSPSNGILFAGNSGCVIIQSSNVNLNTGTYPFTINTTVFLQAGGSAPLSIVGYKIIAQNRTNSTAISGNYTYNNITINKVGTTFNNQQTNGSVYRRVQVLPNNKVGVTWTTSSDGSPFLGRGTGYNQFNGSTWIKGDTSVSRIESQRTGFPSYAFNSNTNEEVVLSHIVTPTGFSGGFVMSRKNVTATSWNQSTVLDTIASVPGLLWCRTSISNNFLHVVACYTDSAQNQPNRVVRNGVRTPVVYSRLNLSTNVWEVKAITLPNYNSLRYYNGSNDSYSIDAIGNNVAILIGSAGQDLSLWKSGNNGTSWARTIIDTIYQAPFIEKSTIIDPAVLVSDNHVHVLLDNNGVSHCFWNQISLLNSDTTDGTWNYFPSASNQELKYWKEGTILSNKLTIATFNGDPVNTTNWQQFTNGNDSRYGTSYYTAQPSAGISSDGKLYCVYSSPTEGENNIGTRDIYAVYSTNGGQSWSTPKNLTAALGSGLEQAFPSIARTVNNKIHLVYSQSGSVGPYTAGQWDINYYAIDTGSLDLNDTLIFNQAVLFSLSDTVLCKGNSLSYTINNAKLYINDTLIASGNSSGSLTPLSNVNIKIKSLDGLVTFKNINVIVNDSLNLQSVYNGSPLNASQVSICGLNKSFQFGVTSNYTGTKNVTWKLNNSNLTNRVNLVDTFTQGGTYEISVQTNSGCKASKQVIINKYNATFNPDFTVNRQIATAPPFDFIFTNQTTPLTSYDFYWNWGDGKIDTSNTQNLLSKTYNNNGLYTIKLVAQNKVTGCKDSVTKASYISCSGANPQPLGLTTTKQNPLCGGEATGSITVIGTGGTTPYTYRINGGTYQSSNTFNNLVAGIYTVDIKDAINNVATKKDTLVNPPVVTVGVITGLNNVPVSSTQSYSIAAQSGASYLWSVINGTLLSGNGTTAIQVQWPASIGIGKIIASVNKGNCGATDTLTVAISPQPLGITSTKQNPLCAGEANGSITVNGSGGTAPYTYRINGGTYQTSNAFNNLIAGIYNIDVKDAQNNVVTKKDTLTNPPAITVGGINGLNGVPVSSSQSYSIAAQSGASYSWSVINGTLLSGNGTTSIQVQWPALGGVGKIIAALSKGNCGAADTLTVAIGGTPLSLTTAKVNETCSGKNDGSISITASGGNSPYMYSLNNGTYQTSNMFNALSGGIYTIRVKDNNQVVVTKFDTITSGVKPTAGIITGPTTVATLAMNNYIVGQQTGVNYLWNITGGVVASGQNTNVVQVAWGSQSMLGKVSVKVTNAGGCSDSSDLNVNVGSVGTNELSISNKVQIYPNPNNGSFAINVLNSNIEQVDIFNSIGQLIWSYTSNETKQSVLEVRLKTTPGIYTVSVKTESGVVNQKLILTQ